MAERTRPKRQVPERLRDEGGFALAMAIFALVLLAAVVAGGYFSASQEFQIGRGMRSVTSSFYAGEAGILKVLNEWDPTVFNALASGDSITVGPYTFEGGGSFTATVVRVGSAADSVKRYFYIEVSGHPAAPALGERRQGAIVRARYPDLCCTAAVKVVDNVTFSGGAQPIISGFNADPPSVWPASVCAGIATDSTPGVIHGPTGTVNDTSRVEGSPVAIMTDPSLNALNLFDFGDLTYDDLVAMADHEFPAGYEMYSSQPSVVDGECNQSDPLNWGAPTSPSHPCFDYFPIIHVKGDLTLTGDGAAQGILLIDRDLNFTGPYRFYGIVLVKDDLLLGGPVDFYGGALVKDDVWVSGATPRFWLSRCAVERAERLSRLTRPQLLTGRAWIQLF
jgi:hypothetical protein